MITWIQVTLVAIVRGFATALKHPFLILIKLGLALTTAQLMLLPILNAISKALDKTVMRETLRDGLYMDVLMDWAHNNRALLGTAQPYQDLIFFCFILLNILFSGGVFAALWRGSLKPKAFAEACLHYLPTFIGVGLLSFVLLIIFVPVPLHLIAMAVQYLYDSGASLNTCFWVWWIGFAFCAILMFSAVVRVFEYARLLVTAPENVWPSENPLICFWKALRFAAKYHIPTFMILAAFAIMHPMLFWLNEVAIGLFPMESQPYWGTFLIGQIFIVSRITASLASHGAHLHFLKTHLEQPKEPEKKPEPEEDRFALWEEDPDTDDQGESAFQETYPSDEEDPYTHKNHEETELEEAYDNTEERDTSESPAEITPSTGSKVDPESGAEKDGGIPN